MRLRSPRRMQLEMTAPAGRRGEPADGRRSRRALVRWIQLAQCFMLGHRWRVSRSMQGYQTCARCHTRRLPLS